MLGRSGINNRILNITALHVFAIHMYMYYTQESHAPTDRNVF